MLANSSLSITEKAAGQIAALKAQDGKPSLRLRITVSGGGCSGFRYDFSLDDQKQEDDYVFSKDDVEVITDEASLGLIQGAEIDYIDNLMEAYFQVNNPQAASSCGCGVSFSVKS